MTTVAKSVSTTVIVVGSTTVTGRISVVVVTSRAVPLVVVLSVCDSVAVYVLIISVRRRSNVGKALTYTVAGVTVVRKYETQSALPDLVGHALAMIAIKQLSLMT